MRRTLLALVCLSAACATHEPYAFRSSVITERGISIPVPPPSLTDAPKQDSNVEVEVQFEVEGPDAEGSVVLRFRDLVGGEERSSMVTAPVDEVLLEGVPIDHSDNCLEFWLEAEGAATEPVLYHTVIAADDQSVDVVSGCD